MPPASSDPLVVICELCKPVRRIPTTRGEAKTVRNDHALDEHRAALLTVPTADRANYLLRHFRITNKLGRPERLPA
jgi:hypothetical protein